MSASSVTTQRNSRPINRLWDSLRIYRVGVQGPSLAVLHLPTYIHSLSMPRRVTPHTAHGGVGGDLCSFLAKPARLPVHRVFYSFGARGPRAPLHACQRKERKTDRQGTACKLERKRTAQGRDGRTARRHHTGILRRACHALGALGVQSSTSHPGPGS